jgi:hypothetical protein
VQVAQRAIVRKLNLWQLGWLGWFGWALRAGFDHLAAFLHCIMSARQAICTQTMQRWCHIQTLFACTCLTACWFAQCTSLHPHHPPQRIKRPLQPALEHTLGVLIRLFDAMARIELATDGAWAALQALG